MIRTAIRWLLPASCALFALASQADAAASAPQSPDPLDAQATVLPAAYRSSLADFRRMDELKPVPWRVANDEVGRIGGYKSLFFSGEGFVCRFRGQGKVWIQTRKLGAFASWVWPFRPVERSN